MQTEVKRVFQLSLPILALAIAGTALGADAPTAIDAKLVAKSLVKKSGPRSVNGYLTSGVGDGSHKTNQELETMIKGFAFLLKSEKTQAKRYSLSLAEASAELTLARNYRLAAKPTDESREQEKKHSSVALQESETVMNAPGIKKSLKLKATYFAGLADINLGNSQAAQAMFLDAIKQDPTSEHAPSMALYAAETSFDQSKFQDAIDQYKMFFPRLNDGQKVVAIYKTAWSHFNLGDDEAAEKGFLRLAGNRKAGAFADDGVKDLAYVMTQHRDEQNVIDFVTKQVPLVPLRIAILTATYRSFQSQSGTVRHPILFAELMRIENDPAKRLSLLISNLRSQQRRYASAESFKDFMVIREQINTLQLVPTSPSLLKVKPELEIEIKALAQSFAETFFGRTQTPEKLAKPEVASLLTDILSFHVEYFPESPDLAASYSIWLDVCGELKDVQCRYKVSKAAYQNPKLEKSKPRMRDEYLAALEVLREKDPAYRTELISELSEIYTQAPDAPETLPFAKRLTALYNEDKNYSASLPILKKINSVENTEEARFRLMYAEFQAGSFDDVLASSRLEITKGAAVPDDQFAKDSAALVRESHLRLAAERIAKGDFAGYEAHIKSYTASETDPKKLEVVQLDYLNRLLDLKSFDRVQEVLANVPPARRLSAAYQPVMARLIAEQIRTAQFAQAAQLVNTASADAAPSALSGECYQVVLALNNGFDKKQLQELAKADAANRGYILGLLTLFKEDQALAYFSMIDSASSPDKNLLLLAHQVQADRSDVELDAKTMKALGANVPEEIKGMALTKSEIEARDMPFPRRKQSVAKANKLTLEIAQRTRILRKRFAKSLDGKVPRVQKRILEAAAGLETKVSALILATPIPSEIQADQLESYKTGVAELAKEFSDQAGEFNKLVTAADVKIQEADEAKLPIIRMTLENWPAPQADVMLFLGPLMEAKDFVGAMIVLDRWKSMSLINDENYYAIRVRILLTKQPSEFMKDYAHRELVDAKQDALLAKWGQTK